MIRTLDLRGSRPTRAQFLGLIPRTELDVDTALDVASEIITAVRTDGSLALREQALRLDKVSDYEIRVPQSHIDEAVAGLSP